MTEIDVNGYPTEEYLQYITDYDITQGNVLEFLQGILSNWWGGDYGWKVGRLYRGTRKVYVSTLGWSGNEEMIYALRSNFIFWALHWYSHQTGGHYVFTFEV